ncbi:MAG: peptide deformylase [Maritimibacter sp.]|nr:peptide deformylase [Maritimibacter sp.]
MTIRSILIHPDPRLKKVVPPLAEITPDIRVLADDMLQTMYDAPGIGLAAPQVGEMVRMMTMDCVKEEGEEPRPLVLINPEITWSSEETSVYEEGCLSIPEQYADVERPAEVKVSWLDVDGAAQEEHFTGLWATCVQHEIDHLDGKLFIDYLKPLKRQMITRKMQKLKRERARA